MNFVWFVYDLRCRWVQNSKPAIRTVWSCINSDQMRVWFNFSSLLVFVSSATAACPMLVPGLLFAPLCNLRGRKSHLSARYVLFIEFERYLFASVVCFLALEFVLYFFFLVVIRVPFCTVWIGGEKRFTPTISGIVNTRRFHSGQQRSRHDEHSIKTRCYKAFGLSLPQSFSDEREQNVGTRNDAVIGRNTSVLWSTTTYSMLNWRKFQIEQSQRCVCISRNAYTYLAYHHLMRPRGSLIPS